MFNAEPVTGGFNGRAVPPMELFGFVFADSPALVIAQVPFGALERLWFLGLAVVVCAGLFARGVLRGRPGRAMNTIRDHEIAAGVMGVPVARYRAGVFVLSSMYGGLAGVLIALVFQRTVPEYFGLLLSLDYLAMIIIGGLGSVAGAVIGAVFISMLPQVLTRYSDALPLVAEPGSGGVSPAEAARLLYGAAVVVIVLFLPGGLFGLAAASGCPWAAEPLPSPQQRTPLSPRPPTQGTDHGNSQKPRPKDRCISPPGPGRRLVRQREGHRGRSRRVRRGQRRGEDRARCHRRHDHTRSDDRPHRPLRLVRQEPDPGPAALLRADQHGRRRAAAA
ncbi:branched-chain amino acid ABC transporter permease [Streptosporangium lutulentum]